MSLNNQLTNPLNNRFKQGAVKNVVGDLKQNKPMKSTNKSMGGFYKPVVKRKAPVITASLNGRVKKFYHFASNIAEFEQVSSFSFRLSDLDITKPETSLQSNIKNLPSRSITDDELLGLTDAQIRLLLKKERTEALREANQLRSAARAQWRAGIDTANTIQRTVKLANPNNYV